MCPWRFLSSGAKWFSPVRLLKPLLQHASTGKREERNILWKATVQKSLFSMLGNNLFKTSCLKRRKIKADQEWTGQLKNRISHQEFSDQLKKLTTLY